MTRLLQIVFLFALMLTAVAWYRKGELPDLSEVRSELRSEPAQGPSAAEPFTFRYKGKEIRVRPVASYELAGLVVSHNNIESIADLYHDSTSVDTKDLCVIWGHNLETSDYRKVQFRSGSFTCYFTYPSGVRFWRRAGSNNHLITDSDEIRERIAKIQVGDQVRFAGLLVDYQVEDWRDFWRQTSTVRSDGGCEVVFVEEVEVLRRGTPGWYLAFRFGRLLLVTLPLLYLVTLHRSVRRRNDAAVS